MQRPSVLFRSPAPPCGDPFRAWLPHTRSPFGSSSSSCELSSIFVPSDAEEPEEAMDRGFEIDASSTSGALHAWKSVESQRRWRRRRIQGGGGTPGEGSASFEAAEDCLLVLRGQVAREEGLLQAGGEVPQLQPCGACCQVVPLRRTEALATGFGNDTMASTSSSNGLANRSSSRWGNGVQVGRVKGSRPVDLLNRCLPGPIPTGNKLCRVQEGTTENRYAALSATMQQTQPEAKGREDFCIGGGIGIGDGGTGRYGHDSGFDSGRTGSSRG